LICVNIKKFGVEVIPASPESGGVELKIIGFWIFAAFVPLAMLGNIMAWRFVGYQGRGD
jgi:hypothetical protein